MLITGDKGTSFGMLDLKRMMDRGTNGQNYKKIVSRAVRAFCSQLKTLSQTWYMDDPYHQLRISSDPSEEHKE